MDAFKIKDRQLFIDNSFVDAVSGKTFATINPQTEIAITDVSEGDKDDIDLAVAAAKRAFHRNSEWRLMDASQRGRLLYKLADLIDRDSEYLAKLETLDNGKPLKYAKYDVKRCADIFRYFAGKADKILGSTIPSDGDVFSMTLKEPVGVCGQILPWNFPILMIGWKVAPALSAGCTIVLKPAEQTPLSALAFASLIKEAGFPRGVVNIVPGYGHTAGHALTHHPDVDKIAFTGSTEIGRVILKAAGEVNIKRVTLELGGKNPLVVCNDYDVDKAVAIAHRSIFYNSGQVCLAASRTYVQAGIYEEFAQKSAELANKRVIGDPFTDVDQGPQVDKETFDKILNYIKEGIESGARLVAGGKRIGNIGYFIEPTVFADVTDDMSIAKEEIFGPVQSIIKFKTLEEVIDKSNNTNYGLTAGILTNDINTALSYAKHVRAGTIWINTFLETKCQAPFGGFKNSGIGREMGDDGIEQYLETKTITLALPKKCDTK